MYFEKYQLYKQKYLTLQKSMQIGRGRGYLDNLLLPHDNYNYNNNNTDHIKVEFVIMSGKSYKVKVNKRILMSHLNDMIINLLVKDGQFKEDNTLLLFYHEEVLIIDDSTLCDKIGPQTDIELTIIIGKKNYNIVCNELIIAIINSEDKIQILYNNPRHFSIIPRKDLEENFSTISCSNTNIAAITMDGQIYCWGSNRYHQVYYANMLRDLRFKKVACGYKCIYAITLDNVLYCWGEINRKEISKHFTFDEERSTIDREQNESSIGIFCWKSLEVTDFIVDIACGRRHTAAITNTGHIMCWGDNGFNQVSPVPNYSLKEHEIFTMVTCGPTYTAGLTSNGRVLCWGKTDDKIAESVSSEYLDKKFVAISASNYCMYGITSHGKCLRWGYKSPKWTRNFLQSIIIPKLEIGETYISVKGYGHYTVAITSRRIISWPDAYKPKLNIER